MDNDAFKEFVRSRSKVQSTKEIARKAVEDEFRRKKKRRKRGEDSSDSDNDGFPRRGELKGKEYVSARNEQQEIRCSEVINKYRDRALERRQGKKPENALGNLREPAKDLDPEGKINQGLGSGLGFINAGKVGKDIPILHKKSPQDSEKESPVGTEQAAKYLKECTGQDRFPSDLAHYIQHVIGGITPSIIDCTPSNPRILGFQSRRVSCFALDGHPCRISLTWEVPTDITTRIHRNQSIGVGAAKPLGFELIDRIVSSLPPMKRLNISHKGHFDSLVATPAPTRTTKSAIAGELDESDDIFDDVGGYQ